MMRYQMEYMMHYQDTDGFQVFSETRKISFCKGVQTRKADASR